MKKAQILEIIYEAKTQGSTLFVENGRLGIKKSKGTHLSADVLTKIKEQKEAIIDFLDVANENLPQNQVISKVTRPEKIPMSYAQERLWFIDKLQGSISYHMPEVLRIHGNLNVNALKEAIRTLVERHEVLRTVFKEYDGIGYQYIMDGADFSVKFSERQNNTLSLEEIIQEEILIPFDLSSDYMLRATIIKETPETYVLILVIHHIAGDGWSMPIMVNEIETYYEQLLSGVTVNPQPLDVQYADYSIWQRDFLSGETLKNKLKYWENKLKEISPLELPADHQRPSDQSLAGAVYDFTLNTEITQRLKDIAKQEGATLFMVLLAAYKVLLFRYTGQADISVGTPVANRNQKAIEDVIGFFVNTLVLRDKLSANTSFTELLKKVKQTCLEAYQNQDVPLEKIIDHLSIARDQNQNALFQTIFSLQNNREINEIKLGDNKVELITESNGTSKFDLTFDVSEINNQLSLSIEYATAIFEEETIRRLASHYQQLVLSIIENIEKPVGYLEIIPEVEKQFIKFKSVNATPIAKGETILSLFSRQVKNTPSAIALLHKDSTMTYAELDARSNQLAHYLQDCGVDSETLVPFCLDRSLDVYVAMLGILKAGGAYIPIDVNYPASRIEYMLVDSAATVVITAEKFNTVFNSLNGKTAIITIEKLNKVLNNYTRVAPRVEVLPNQLMYAIYTSGTTGNAKGTLVEHQSVIRLCDLNEVTFNEQTRMLQLASISFDAAVIEIWATLLRGGTLVIYPETEIDLRRLNEVMSEYEVNTTWFTAGLLDQWVLNPLDNSTLKYIIAGGDVLKPSTIKKLQDSMPQLTVVNGYGPTENTVFTTCYKIPTDFDINRSIPIGYPIPGTSVIITDEQMQPVPVGVPGELLASGIGLSRGYLNQAELTQTKFIEHPYFAGERVYKTGDLARWNVNGAIEFLGRKDQQVKIRGFRIELSEIEVALQQINTIKQSVVIVKNDSEDRKQLVAYFKSDSDIKIKTIKLELQEKLPAYMIPSIYVKLDAFPLTSNGKINRRMLPEPGEDAFERAVFIAPVSKEEIKLANIWKGVLGVQKIGINDNFFALGGDSIKAIQLVSRCHAAGFHFKVKDVFKHQTISELITRIENNHQIKSEQGKLQGKAPLHPVQKMFFGQNFANPDHYNQSVLLKVPKTVSPKVLQQALDFVVQQHDALCFSYNLEPATENVAQQYGDYSPQLIQETVEDLGQTSEICARYQAALNIENGDLLKYVFIQTAVLETHNRLFFTIHHLAVDGVSWRIILEDLANALKALQSNKTPEAYAKGTSYRQWVNSLIEYGMLPTMQAEYNYWAKVLQSNQSVQTDFPEDHTIATYQNMKSVHVQLDKTGTNALTQKIHHAYQTNINDILLSAFSLSLQQLVNGEEVVIALEGHGREELFENTDISRTVGWFTSMYPVQLDLSFSTNTIPDLISYTKDMLHTIPQKGIGYGILRYLSESEEIRTSLSKSFDSVVFNYLGDFDNSVSNDSEETYVDFATEDSGAEISGLNQNNHLISVNSLIVKGALQLEWSYNSKRFKEETIQKLAATYIDALQNIISHCAAINETYKTPGDYLLPEQISFNELQTFLQSTGHTYELEDICPLSPLQEGMLFHSLYDTNKAAYLVQFQCEIKGPFSMESFRKSWEYLMKKHSILRTGIMNEGLGVPVQCVYKEVPVPIEVQDYTSLPEKEAIQKVDSFIEKDKHTEFDLAKAPLFRIALLKLNEHATQLVLTNHHILWDGWSFSKLISNFMECYTAFETATAPPDLQVDNFSGHVKTLLGKHQETGLAFWKNYLSAVTSPIHLPFVKDATLRNKIFGDQEYNVNFTQQVCTGIETLSEKYNVTNNTLIQAAWSFLLAKYTGQNQIVFGTTVSGRDSDINEIEDKIGLYINTIPVYTTLHEKEKLAHWLKSLQETHTTAREEYSYLPLGIVEAQSQIKASLFDTLLVFENYPVEEGTSDKFHITNAEAKDTTNYTLSVSVLPSAEGISVKYMYNDQLLEKATIANIHRHLETVLQSMANGAESIGDIAYITPPEEACLLSDFNQTALALEEGLTVLGLFNRQLLATPQAPAIYTDDAVISYADLESQANRLANYFQKTGIKKGSLVPVCMHRSLDMYVSILALLKCGAAYVPIDPEYPSHRIGLILEDLSAQWIVTQNMHRPHFEGMHSLEIISLDEVNLVLPTLAATAPVVNITGEDLAYMIYTSGTTGVPKGVMITHDSLYGLLSGMSHLYPLTHGDRMAFKTNYGFDVSVYELFGWIPEGGSMVIVPSGLEKDPKGFLAFLETTGITHVNLVPSLFGVLLESLSASDTIKLPELRYLFLAGEALPPAMVATYHRLGMAASLINIYGPTEGTIYSTHYTTTLESGNATSISIGKPLPNTQAYILDEQHRLVPVGVVGELCISGRGLAQGYYGREELTATRFVPHPYIPGARLYKTGDLASWAEEGTIRYVGRKDTQVKLRGYRIELSDISAVLDQHQGIRQSVVVFRTDSVDNQQLVCYYTGDTAVALADLKAWLTDRLPAYMVPQVYVLLESFPLSPSGKIDRKALPVPDKGAYQSATYQAPESPIELQLATIWRELLDIEKIGVHDNFFELGGHSILAMRVVSRIQIITQKSLELIILFENPTIAQLAKAIEASATDETYNEIPLVAKQELYSCSVAQTRIWLADQVSQNRAVYNITTAFEIKGNIDEALLFKAIQQVIERHEILRTNYIDRDGVPYQKVQIASAENVDFEVIKTQDIRDRSLEILRQENAHAFDLLHDKLIRFRLVTSEAKHIFIINMHHIAGDGWSIGILQNDLLAFYNALSTNNLHSKPVPLPIQYKDYAAWYNKGLQHPDKEAMNFWVNKLNGTNNRKELPLDSPRTQIRGTEAEELEFSLGKELSQLVQKTAKANSSGIFTVLQALVKCYLKGYLSTQDIIVGTPVAGRNHPQLEDQIGFYVNVLALRTMFTTEETFNTLLNKVINETREAFKHQFYPIEQIIKDLKLPRALGRNQLFDVLISYNDGLEQEVNHTEFTFNELEFKLSDKRNKYDLSLDFTTEGSQVISGSITYNTNLFYKDSMLQMKTEMLELFEKILTTPNKPLEELIQPRQTEVSLVDDFS